MKPCEVTACQRPPVRSREEVPREVLREVHSVDSTPSFFTLPLPRPSLSLSLPLSLSLSLSLSLCRVEILGPRSPMGIPNLWRIGDPHPVPSIIGPQGSGTGSPPRSLSPYLALPLPLALGPSALQAWATQPGHTARPHGQATQAAASEAVGEQEPPEVGGTEGRREGGSEGGRGGREGPRGPRPSPGFSLSSGGGRDGGAGEEINVSIPL